MSRSKAFTLVELAIVITIIGLLIGGVLKGQELLENSRMTAAYSKLKSYGSAVVTFRDIYKALPGDMVSPGNFIKNCTATPCSTSGDGNGIIGPVGTFSDENNNFWVHLQRAELVSGIDPNSSWTGGTLYAAAYPQFDLGAKVMMIYFSTAAGVNYPDGAFGHWFYMTQPNGTGSSYAGNIPAYKIGRMDLKYDDARAWQGEILIAATCTGQAFGTAAYDPNNNNLCTPGVKAGF